MGGKWEGKGGKGREGTCRNKREGVAEQFREFRRKQ
jgi:hypothetical protein